MSAVRRIYVIRKDQSDWTPIVAVITGPKSPALSTMMRKFNERFDVPKERNTTVGSEIMRYIQSRQLAISRAQIAGHDGHDLSDLFVDWLLKQNAGFEGVKFEEVSL